MTASAFECRPTSKEQQSREIDDHVAAFLASGGTIKTTNLMTHQQRINALNAHNDLTRAEKLRQVRTLNGLGS